MSNGLQGAYIRCATPGCNSWIWANRWNSPAKTCAQCNRTWESSWQWNGYEYPPQNGRGGKGKEWPTPVAPMVKSWGKGQRKGQNATLDAEAGVGSLPPWQETAQQLLASQSPGMPEEVRLSLEKALQAEQAKQQEGREPTKAEATERFQKATSQLKRAGQAKLQAEQRLEKAKEQVALQEAKLQAAAESLQAAEAEVEESSKVYWKYALGLPKDAEMGEAALPTGDEDLIQTILADMGGKLRPEQQQRLLDMAGVLRDQKRRKVDEQMVPVEPGLAKVEEGPGSG